MNLTEFLGRQRKVTLVVIGIGLAVSVFMLDFATGPEFQSSVFYLVPISFFSWFLGKRSGFTISFICTAIALPIHRSNFPYVRQAIVYWNALAWLAVYVFFNLIISELRGLYKRERAWAQTDILTDIPNRRSFFSSLDVEKNHAKRYQRPLTLAYVDLDRFKKVNDTFGHDAGDKLLRVVANVMKSSLRQADIVGRLGGDEFAVLLPETDRSSAETALTKLKGSLDATMKHWGWPVTFSIGVVTFHPPPESVQEMIGAADGAMYSAKKNGGDRLLSRTANEQPPGG